MTYEPLNRRLSFLAAIFAFLGVILGSIALATNYWTITTNLEPIYNGTSIVGQQENGYRWNVCIILLSLKKTNFLLGSFSNLSNW
jgi:hypothetical protein